LRTGTIVPIVIREYRDEDWPQVAAIWSLAFLGGEPFGREHRLMRHADAAIFAAEDEEGLVGAAKVIPMNATCRGVELPAGGLGAVAVGPEHRRQGVGSSLMHWLVWEMRRRGMALSVLYAANAGFYRSFGYAAAGTRMEFDCPTHKLPRMHEDLPIQRLPIEAWPEVAAAYEAFAGKYSGMVRRKSADDSLLWILKGTTPTIVAVGRPVEAYAVLRLNAKFFRQQKVAEIAWTTPRGWRAMIDALGMFCINASSVSWCEPSDGPYLARHGERGVGIRGWMSPMYRVLDVAAALSALRPGAGEGAGSFTLAVQDELVPDNRGPWRVTFEAGRVGVEAAGGVEPDLTLPIDAFTQALLGEPDLAAVAAQGSVRVGPAGAAGMEAARRLFAPRPVYCLDFF
jgi:predicted acetyltransferase